MKKIICLYGGPGTGKTTTSLGLGYNFKLHGFNAELVREYVKGWVWEQRKIKEADQTYFFAKQSRTERQLIEQKLEVIITDSPLILTHFYGLKYDKFEKEFNTSLDMLRQHHAFCKDHGYKVDHYFLTRTKPYNSAGRYQDEENAKLIDQELRPFLEKLNIKYQEIPGDDNAVKTIMNNYLQVPFHSFLNTKE